MEVKFTRNGAGGSFIKFLPEDRQFHGTLKQRVEKKIRELETILLRYGGQESEIKVHIDMMDRQDRWEADFKAKMEANWEERLLEEARRRKSNGLDLNPKHYEILAQKGEI